MTLGRLAGMIRKVPRAVPGNRAAVAVVVMLASASPADARVTRAQAERLVGIALVTEWVAANCDAGKLAPMLLLTTPSVLKQLEPDMLALGRKRIAERAARFPSRKAACERWSAELVAIQ